jgi:hypothetical protein
MKKIILFFTLISSVAFAQEELKKTIKDKSQNDKDRIVMQLSSEMWLTKPDSVEVKGTSRGFGLYWMFVDLPVGSPKLTFSFGLGAFASNIFNNASVNESDTFTSLVPIPTSFDYKRTKIVTTYLELPIELRYCSNPDNRNNSFKMGVGFKGGLLVGSHSKIKTKARDVNGNLTVYKENGIKFLNQYRYGPTFRIGYGSFNVFAYYSLSTLFVKNKGPEIVPFSVGFLISEF